MSHELNQDVEILGKVFRFQTRLSERSGLSVRSEVLLSGRSVATREVCFDQREDRGEEIVRAWMKEQHKRVLEMFIRRALRYQTRVKTPAPAEHHENQDAVAPNPPPLERLKGWLKRHTNARHAAPSATETESLARALRVRNLFGRFSTRIGATSMLQPTEVDQRLERACQAFDDMMSSSFFAEIRIDEQVRCHLLKDEIDEWLESPRDPKLANAIWSEVVTFKNYLAEVNHRAELIAFDRRMVEWALAEVKRRGMTEDVLRHLGSLYGLLPQLSRLLDHPDGVSEQAWIAQLRNALTLTDPHATSGDAALTV